MRAVSHEFALRQPTARRSFVPAAPPRLSSPFLPLFRSTQARRHRQPQLWAAAFYVRHFTSTLEPALCARNNEADSECVSTTGRFLAESFVMRGDFFETQTVSFGFYVTSRHCIPRLSPRNSHPNAITANNGAAANCSARHAGCYGPSRHLRPSCPRHLSAASAPRSAVAELESLGDATRLP